jgi:HSP20 family protein
MYDLMREMDRIFAATGRSAATRGDRFLGEAWPAVDLTDEGGKIVVRADLPGLTEKDIELNATQNSLTLAGERKLDVPEGYSVHRQERPVWKFSRSFELPCRIDLEKVAASMKNGVLTVELGKHAAEKPRQITVKAS